MIQEPTWPGTTLFAVTPSNSTEFSPAVRQLYIGVGGNVVVLTEDNVTVTFANTSAGATIGPFFIKKVLATGTTAGSIVAFV